MKILYNIKVKNSDKRKGNVLCYRDDNVYKNYYTANIEKFTENEITHIEEKEDYILIDVMPSMYENEILIHIRQKTPEGYISSMESITLNKTNLKIVFQRRGEIITLRNAKIKSITKYNNDFNSYFEIDYRNSDQCGSCKINIWDIQEMIIKS